MGTSTCGLKWPVLLSPSPSVCGMVEGLEEGKRFIGLEEGGLPRRTALAAVFAASFEAMLQVEIYRDVAGTGPCVGSELVVNDPDRAREPACLPGISSHRQQLS